MIKYRIIFLKGEKKMFFRAKRTSENMALSLFSAVILYFVHICVSDISFGSVIASKLVSTVFAALRLLVPAFVFLRMQKRSGFEKMVIEKPFDRSPAPSIRITFVAFALVFVFGVFYSMAFPDAGSAYSFDDPVLAVITLISAVIVPAFLEEYLYRELFCRELTVYGHLFAIIGSALFFGLMHFSYYSFPYAFICGLVIGFVYLKTGSVKYTVALHLANNLLSYILSIVGSLTDGETYFRVLMVTVVVICAVALPTMCFLIPSSFVKFSGKEHGNASSSAFLTFPMTILIACILILNFI